MNKQAEELNEVIREANPVIYDILSEKGKAIFFPKEGILKQADEAMGKRINATVGAAMEEDGTPMTIRSVAKNFLLYAEDVFPYASSYGKPALRKFWMKKIRKKNPSLDSVTSLPVVTNGLTHALSMAGYLFVDPGDKVILTDKFWGNYRLIFENAFGGKLDTFNTFNGGGFDTQSMRKKLAEYDCKKILLLNFPNNPAGYSPTITEAAELVSIIKECAEKGDKLIVICDDAYFGLVYREGIFEESLFAKLAGLHKNVLAIKIDGPTKEEYVWGLRLGFITFASKGLGDAALQALETKTAGAVRGNISNTSHASQSAVTEAFSSPVYDAEKKDNYQVLKARFDKIQEVLKDGKYDKHFSPLPYNSGYFMCVEIKTDAEKVRKVLLEKYDTGVIAVGNLLRIAFSSVAEKDIPLLFENIYNACREVS